LTLLVGREEERPLQPLQKMSDGMLAVLSFWSKAQMICIWCS